MMPECECGHVAPSMDHLVDHINDEHGAADRGVAQFVVGDA